MMTGVKTDQFKMRLASKFAILKNLQFMFNFDETLLNW